ncbi:hypothetical protein E8E14_010314 [Neopestalotiopsis sp. 37M]|nr:hypothetical protein E8E14_010314 [Neopestalotiopsis sp. 37M]
MARDFNFKASKKMYNSHFKSWGMRKNRQKPGPDGVNRDQEASVVKGPRTRPRRLQQPQTQNDSGRLAPTTIRPRIATSLSKNEAEEVVILAVGNYVAGLFESQGWVGDGISISLQSGEADQSTAWQNLSDECFSAAKLIEDKKINLAFEKFNQMCAKLEELIVYDDLGMMIKLWRILLRVHCTCKGIGHYGLLRTFLGYLNALAKKKHRHGHPMRQLLAALFRLSDEDKDRDELISMLKLGYLKAIKSIEKKVGEANPVTLHMWSNYLKTCDQYGLPSETLLRRFQDALGTAEAAYGQFGPATVEILHKYMYSAYYNACNGRLSCELASILLQRASRLDCIQNTPSWCLPTQGFALAAKILALSQIEAGDLASAKSCVKDASLILMKGDSPCQARASLLMDLIPYHSRDH